MGLFDVFKGGGGGLKKHVTRVANKRAQKHERWESIQVLAADGSDEALRALLTRFTVRVDPSITDGEEKNEGLRSTGKPRSNRCVTFSSRPKTSPGR